MPHFLWEQRRSSGIPYTNYKLAIFIQVGSNTQENNSTMKKKHTTRNSKILHQTLVSLGALKGAQTALNEMHINEIQVHLLDEGGDGVILCLEYEEQTGELKKTFSCVDEFYDDTVEVELTEGDDAENENALFDEDYYGGRTNFTVEVLDDVSEKAESSFIEEAISEEYDEIFHNSNSDGKPPLLNWTPALALYISNCV